MCKSMCVTGNVYVSREVKGVGPVSVSGIYTHPCTGEHPRDRVGVGCRAELPQEARWYLCR